MEELRKEGYFSLSDVDTVVLETGGNITVIPTKEAALPTNKDIGINTPQQKISYIMIADGKVRLSELENSGKDMNWLRKKLHEKGISSVKDVFVFSQDGSGNIYVQKKEKDYER